jgi:segregation and condensation protein A
VSKENTSASSASNEHEGLNPAPATASEVILPASAASSEEAEQHLPPGGIDVDDVPVAEEQLLPPPPAAASVEPPQFFDMPGVSETPATAGTDETVETTPVPEPTFTASTISGQKQAITGIEILIDMAAKNEIDPKNIDIIDVTDRFLKAISAVPKENLRQSGKIIFQASVLLRMKAEALLAQKVEEEFVGDDYVDFDIDGSPLIYDSNHQIIARQITLADLERALVRQTKVRQMRHRRVTLEQLIEALREAERLEQARGDRKVKPRIAIDGYNEMRDMDDILDLAHDEDIEDVISRIERLLTDLLAADDLLPLLRIIESLGGHGDWVDAFLAVLFLSNAGKISLQQEQFYGPLFIMRPTEGAPLVIPAAGPDSGPPLSH